jgi:hypothetical protein
MIAEKKRDPITNLKKERGPHKQLEGNVSPITS